MIKVDIEIDDKLSNALQNMRKELYNYPKDAAGKFITLTPARTGNARRHTKLVNNRTIQTDYPYAERLDNGYSKQAPRGMTKPFEEWVKQKLKKIFGK